MSGRLLADDGHTQAAVVCAKGMRAAMEDCHVLCCDEDGAVVGAIFDGHGGSQVAEMASTRFASVIGEGHPPLGQVLREIHTAIGLASAGTSWGGACAVAFRLHAHRLEVANLGDAELARWEPGGISVVTQMHRLSNLDERARVVAAGCAIGTDGVGNEVYVIDPALGRGLMPTRSLGDHEFGSVGISGEPYETEVHFGSGWLIAACDGVWDVIRPDELPEIIGGTRSAELAAHRVALEAFDRGSSDNITVIALRRAAGGTNLAADPPRAARVPAQGRA